MMLSELMQRHDPEDILTINNGAMPKTGAECYELHEKLCEMGK